MGLEEGEIAENGAHHFVHRVDLLLDVELSLLDLAHLFCKSLDGDFARERRYGDVRVVASRRNGFVCGDGAAGADDVV